MNDVLDKALRALLGLWEDGYDQGRCTGYGYIRIHRHWMLNIMNWLAFLPCSDYSEFISVMCV